MDNGKFPLVRKPAISLPEKNREKIQAIIDPLILSDDAVHRTMQTFAEEMQVASSSSADTRKKSSLIMGNTFIPELLKGSEEGQYLGLDLGGSNFRVLLCEFLHGQCHSIFKSYSLPSPKFTGTAAQLFDHLAASIAEFVEDNQLTGKKLPLGFTFSFPTDQLGLKEGLLVTWTKSIACPDGRGMDVVKLLEEAIARRKDLNVEVVALLNDTVGTLLAGSYQDHECAIGMVLGTGSNAAYIEKTRNIEKIRDNPDCQDEEVVVDIEWGGFGDKGSLQFIKTEFDYIIDSHSHHPGVFTFEKLFAGFDIGDYARLIILKLVQEKLMCHGHVTEKLQTWRAIKPRDLSDIEREGPKSTAVAAKLLKRLELEYADEDLMVVKYIVSTLAIRTAQLTSACLAEVIKRVGRKKCTIAADGSLYRLHPTHHALIMGWLNYLLPGTEIVIIDAEDGSGKGAAFVAAVAVRIKQQNTIH